MTHRTLPSCTPVPNTDTANSNVDDIIALTSTLQDPQPCHVDKHSCWICQEDFNSEALLLEHYETHMRHV